MKILLSSVVVLGLFFTGCSVKQDAQMATNAQANKPVTEKVLDESSSNVAVMTESVYFDFDKYNIKNDMQKVVETNNKNVQEFLKNYNTFMISVEGHCDDRGTDEYNYALGLKRAQSVKATLIDSGISDKNIVTKSLGEASPVCTEKTKECWAKNRRVDYILK